MKIKYAAFAAVLLICVAFPAVAARASSVSSAQYYTYNYDAWGDTRESPNPYTPSRTLMGVDLGVGSFKEPQSLYARGEKLWIVDSGNNRIVECDGNFKLVRVIDGFMNGGQPDTFSYPSDVFVSDSGEMYVADTNNQRIVHLDSELNLIKIISKPSDALMTEISEFLPQKLVVDNANRLYLQARNVNKGLMEFDERGAFTGYVGANQVNFSVADMIWKTISTRRQREQMMLFVPTEYSNVALDHKGFMYTTCSTVSESDIISLFDQDTNDILAMLFGIGQSSNVQPIRRLNAMGADILIRNGWVSPVGDWDWGDAGDVSGPSRFVDIVPIENDTYFALDRTRGRIFAYDFQGNLLYVFGGLGNRPGYFQYPTAIEYLNGKLLVLDGRAAGVTVFTPTEYGTFIHTALNEYIKGNYEASAEVWEKVLTYNANYDLAYIGLGRARLRQDRFEEAMEYFKLKLDHKNYSKAYQQYRKQVIEENIGYLIGGVIVLIVGWNGFKIGRRVLRYRKMEN